MFFTVPAGESTLDWFFDQPPGTATIPSYYWLDDIVIEEVDDPVGEGSEAGDSDGKGYRYGFNGMENDNEISGTGNNLDFGARIYDSRLGRWLSRDSYADKYPNVSSYSFCINSPLQFKDVNGNWLVDKNGNIIYTIGNTTYEKIGDKVYYGHLYYFYTNDGQPVEAVKLELVTSVGNVLWGDDAKTEVKSFGIDYNKVDVVPNIGYEEAINCHGKSLNFRPGVIDYLVAGLDEKGQDNVSKIYKNTAEFTLVKSENVQPGDIAIFDDGNGNIAHSAIVSKVGKGGSVKLTSKDDRKKTERNQTIEGIKKGNPLYKNFVGFYRKNENKAIDIEVNEQNVPGFAGYDDDEKIQKILENVKKE